MMNECENKCTIKCKTIQMRRLIVKSAKYLC
jgi:hypothetical protein